jgi:selenocysteine lyase/cysteine desulfurase
MTALLTGNGTRFDPSAVRRRLQPPADTVHLAACSLAPRTTLLDQAMTAVLTAMDIAGTWPAFEQRTAVARARFAGLVGASTDQISVQPNASTAAFQIASSSRWSRRRTIITTTAEFPGIAHVWLAQRVHGAEILFVGDRDGHVTAQDYLTAIDAGTALVSIPAVTYRDGRRLPVAQIAAAAQAAGARVFIDAYQAAGAEPVDVTALNCDYLVAGTAKYLLGLPGVAFLYLREPTGTDQRPQLTGWQGHTRTSTPSTCATRTPPADMRPAPRPCRLSTPPRPA